MKRSLEFIIYAIFSCFTLGRVCSETMIAYIFIWHVNSSSFSTLEIQRDGVSLLKQK